MKTKLALGLTVLPAFLALLGCSGVPQGTTGAGGGGGGTGSESATLSVTMTSKPALSLTNISVLAANVGITGITFSPSTGAPVSLTLNPTVYPVDLARLQSDSAFLGSLTLPAATYSAATLTFSAPVLTVLNQSGATLNGTCLNGAICKIVLTAGSATVSAAPFPITLTSAETAGISLNVDLNTALTLSANTLAINFSATNAATAATLPRTGAPSGSLDLIEDFVGKVTAVSSSSLTVQSNNGSSLQFKMPSSLIIEDPQGLCAALDSSCLVANQTVVSVDATLNTDGTLSVISADLLDAAPVDEVEGTLIQTAMAGQFNLVVSNQVVATGNSTLTSASPGDVFLVTLSNPLFIVDGDEFFNNGSIAQSTLSDLFTGEGNLQNGQDVMVQVTGATGSASSGNQALTADTVRLRFTRTTGTIQSVSGQAFTLSNLPPVINLTGNPEVETITGVTNFDGVTDVNSLSAGQTVSIRALLLPDSTFAFSATTVRLQP